jgi:hypothetical protein
LRSGYHHLNLPVVAGSTSIRRRSQISPGAPALLHWQRKGSIHGPALIRPRGILEGLTDYSELLHYRRPKLGCRNDSGSDRRIGDSLPAKVLGECSIPELF